MKAVLEEIKTGLDASIIAFEYSKKTFDAPWHFHPQIELTFVKSSVGTKLVGDYVGSYQPGEIVLLNSNLPHCWKNQIEENVNAESLVVQWESNIFPKIPELQDINSMIKLASKGILFQKSETDQMLPILFKCPQLKGSLLYQNLLTVLSHLSRCRFTTLSEAVFENGIEHEASGKMEKIHDFIEKNYSSKFYLKALADQVNMTEQSFSRFFTKMMGRPFFTFLNEYRINIACRYLLDTDKSISEICFSCGYESLPFFHKQFIKYKNKTPFQFKQEYKK